MCKLAAFSVLLASFVLSAAQDVSSEQSEMRAAGLSDKAIEGIVSFSNAYVPPGPLPSGPPDRAFEESVFNDFLTKIDGFIKTLSQEDQSAYATYIAKKRADLEARHTAGHA